MAVSWPPTIFDPFTILPHAVKICVGFFPGFEAAMIVTALLTASPRALNPHALNAASKPSSGVAITVGLEHNVAALAADEDITRAFRAAEPGLVRVRVDPHVIPPVLVLAAALVEVKLKAVHLHLPAVLVHGFLSVCIAIFSW